MAAKGKGLAIIFGGGPKKGEPEESDDEMMSEDDEMMSDDESIPPDFEAAAAEAFPEMAEDSERIAALYRAIRAAG